MGWGMIALMAGLTAASSSRRPGGKGPGPPAAGGAERRTGTSANPIRK